MHFEFTRSGVLNNWEVLDGAKEHFNKLLITFKDDRYNLIPDLVCMKGFKEMLPEVLRFIDIDVLKNSVSNPKNFNIWQYSVEDLYEDSKAREEIRNNPMLSCAFVEILNALISNGSAIAYIIRDYYI